jgi:hypothetical protein
LVNGSCYETKTPEIVIDVPLVVEDYNFLKIEKEEKRLKMFLSLFSFFPILSTGYK